jgi:hypothetical protein
LKYADYIVVTSPALLEYSSILKKHTYKVKVIPLSFNIGSCTYIQKTLIPDCTKKILFVGKLREYKGVQFLIESIVDLDVKLFIVGEGEYLNVLKTIVDKYNIKIDAKIEPMSQNTAIPKGEFTDQPGEGEYSPEEKEDMDAKRRLINALTQGAGVRGSRSFLLMKDYLDSVDPTLVDKYGKILDVALGGYDDENFIAQILAGIANDNNMPGGSSLPEYDKANKQWIVKARAINFPILIHEIVKGIYSVIGSRGWSKNKALNQASVASVDKLRNEPDDLRYGKFMLDAISDAINKFYNKSNVSDPYVRDVFMAKLVELPYSQLRDFIQNAINGELNAGQEKWAKDTISKISSLKEYKVNKPNSNERIGKENIDTYGEYNDDTNTFEVEMGSDRFIDYMDDYFEGWNDDEDIADKGHGQYIKDIEQAVKTKYSNYTQIELI